MSLPKVSFEWDDGKVVGIFSRVALMGALLATAGAGPLIGISPTPFAPNGPCA